MIFKNIDNVTDGIILKPTIYKDNRGWFYESYNKKWFSENGISVNFVQENRSYSYKGVLRGVHTQVQYPYEKLLTCIRGEIFDVLVDTRKSSPTYKKWFGIILSERNHLQVYIPKGVAHGYLTLSDEAEISFLVSEHYHPGDELGFLWNDSEVGIEWPKLELPYIIAEKDTKWNSFTETF